MTCLLGSFLTNTHAASYDGLIINEIQAANIDQFTDPSWNYGGWIELYNANTCPYNLQGCWVSDDAQNLKKAHITQPITILGQSYKNLWFDHHDKFCPTQLKMKLDLEGGTIFLSDEDGNLITSQEYPAPVPRTSWARLNETSNEWGYTDQPTPEAANGAVVFCQSRFDAPCPSEPSQIFDKSVSFRIEIPEGATLRYTTDGAAPSLTRGEKSDTGDFTVSATTVFRFAFFREGFMTSPVITRTFIKKDKKFSLPIIAIATDPDNLYSDEKGIFVKGVNGRAGRGQNTNCNWNMDWDRPANFEFLYDEESKVNQECEIAKFGGWSRANTPHSFKLHASKLYEGNNSFNCKFFPDKSHNKYKTLKIRSGGGDNMCRVKDPFIHKIVQSSGLDVDIQDYQPVAHYINGVYKGVINMREPTNKHYVYSNYGLDEEEIDMFEMNNDSGYIQTCGTKEAFLRLYNLSKKAADANVYEEIKNLLDIDEFCNFFAVELYLGNWDWPQNNMKGWRPKEENGKFRFIMFDMDASFSEANPFKTLENKQIYGFDYLYYEDVPKWITEIELITIFKNLMQNEQIRKRFVDSFCLVAGSVFEPSRCKEIINRLAAKVEPMQILPDNGYGKNGSPWPSANSLISALSGQASNMYIQLKNYSLMALNMVPQYKNVKISTNLPESRILLNGNTIPTGHFDGQLFGKVNLKAEAPSGYSFKGWKIPDSLKWGNIILRMGDEWSYYDKGDLTKYPWNMSMYNVSKWNKGNAPFGYGIATGGYATELNYGGDKTNRYITYYFRKSLRLDEVPSSNDIFTFHYKVDDGFILYINGKEVTRCNMPDGDVDFYTPANKYAAFDPFTGSIDIDASYFRKGVNVIAVELHNNSKTSSDVYWDGQINWKKAISGDSIKYYRTENEIELAEGDVELMADYEVNRFFGSRPIVINEVSASNSIAVNEYFNKSDWIELYNNSSDTIDIEGFYLSDDINKPLKCQLSANDSEASTKIPAHGFCIIWCDKQKSITELHVPFKLGNEDGESVILTSPDQSYADTLQYCRHDGTESVGRFPDGGNCVYLMNHSTILSANRMNMYAQKISEKTEDSPSYMDQLHDNSLSISYSFENLCIRSEEKDDLTLNIHTIDGKKVMSQHLLMRNNEMKVNIYLLVPGIYVASLSDKEGHRVSIKFIKN